MWFDAKHITLKPVILIEDLHGYVLPHAGTEFTGDIISHTLRFKPVKKFKKIVILYYPASKQPDVLNYYHEYYVPWQSLLAVFGDAYTYEGYNINELAQLPSALNLKETLIVVSADFSHFLPMQEALELENKAARALMFKEFLYGQVIDDLHTFKALYNKIPKDWQLQWVGRDRSAGLKAVGYLSFLLRETPEEKEKKQCDGIFITAYSKDMVARECLGKWFAPGSGGEKWSLAAETQLKKEVLELGASTSRLTGGLLTESPLTHYAVTYLSKEHQPKHEHQQKQDFIRGWHGVLHEAFYLPDVFLENTFKNGHWITPADKTWPPDTDFDLTETLQHLRKKAGHLIGGRKRTKSKRSSTKRSSTKRSSTKRSSTNKRSGGRQLYTLYRSHVVHYVV